MGNSILLAEEDAMRRDTELRLIERAAAGDFQSFEEIIRTYQTPVYLTALRIVMNAAAAEDVAQETFLHAYQSLGSLKNRDSLAPWMRAIARNRALGWLREQKKIAPLEAAPVQSAKIADPVAAREVELFSGDIARIVASLPETARMPLILCYLRDVPTATAARFLGIEAGTLRKRLHDGKKKLQREVVAFAERTCQENRLPRDFARKCICRCRRSGGEVGQTPAGKEVKRMEKKTNCGCGCQGELKSKPAPKSATTK